MSRRQTTRRGRAALLSLATAAAAISATGPALGRGPEPQSEAREFRRACRSDVERLCSDQLQATRAEISTCLGRQRSALAPACRDALGAKTPGLAAAPVIAASPDVAGATAAPAHPEARNDVQRRRDDTSSALDGDAFGGGRGRFSPGRGF